MAQRHTIITLIGFIFLLPIVGFGLTYALNLIAPLSEYGSIYHFFYTLLIITFGLGIPYAMLKLISYTAHEVNPDENIIEIKDLPKDKEDIDEAA